VCELLFFDIPVKFLWKAKPSMSYTSGEPWETTVESINVPHSAAVQAMQCSANNVLVTGGADKKVPFCQSSQSMVLIKLCCAQLFMTDIERRIQTCSTKFSDNVSFLMLNPLDPQLLLITTTGQNNQFTLMDTRTYSTVLKFGWPEVPEFCSFSGAPMFCWPQTRNLSSYTRPSWSRTGNMVACPGGGERAGVQLWDVCTIANFLFLSHRSFFQLFFFSFATPTCRGLLRHLKSARAR